MKSSDKVEITVIRKDNLNWFVLNEYSNSGLLRAATISKPRHVHDWDGHHCEEISAKTSIRYHPKRWNINNSQIEAKT